MLEVARIQPNQYEMKANNTHSLNIDLVADFINYIDVSENTVKTYARGLKQFFGYLASEGIQSPVRADILAFKDALRERGLAPNTINIYIISVRRFFEWADTEGHYPNIAKGIKGVKVTTGFKKDYLTADDINAVLDNIDTSNEQGARNYAMIALMATAGLRLTEVATATVGFLDDDRLYIIGKGREEADEYVKLSDHVQTLLKAYLNTYRPNAKADEALFTGTSNRNKGQPMETRSIGRIIKTCFKDVGLDSKRLTSHSLRHSTATLNLINGGSLEETQQLLRHSSINTTMIYLHHIEREHNESEQRISNAIFNNEGGRHDDNKPS